MPRRLLPTTLCAATLCAATLAPLPLRAQRPPTMGWSSWNTFALDINESLILGQARAMHQSGLQAAGYRYVNIDDGFWDGRADDGHLRINTERFPNGMRHVADEIHRLGLKAGIYSDAGDNSCGSGQKLPYGMAVGLYGHEDDDIRTYLREWDYDFIKVDFCGGRHLRLQPREQYTRIRQAIRRCGKRDVVYNMCTGLFPGTWGADVFDSWRTTYDIYDAWKSVRSIVAENLFLSAYCHDGHYNDMDMLEVGRSMTQVEDETHFVLWCIMASPLLIGCDLTTLADKPQTLRLLTNRDLIALNQDPLHLQAHVAERQGDCYVLVKDIRRLRGRERAVALYNPTDTTQTLRLAPATLELAGAVEYYDCLRQAPFVRDTGTISITLPAHGTRVFRATGQRRLMRRTYHAATAYCSAYQELLPYQKDTTAIYTEHPLARGGYVVRFLGQKEQNDLQWRDVHVPATGTYRLTFTYFAAEPRDMELEVNGQHITRLHTTSRNGLQPGRIALDLRLRKGRNTVRLYNADGWMPDLEGMDIERRAESSGNRTS